MLLTVVIGGGLGCFAGCHSIVSGISLVVVTAILMNDVLGYFVGKAVGRHHPFPQISPKKSIEGYLGGAVGVVVAFWLGAICIPKIAAVGLGKLAVLGLVLWPLACAGDLFFSACKRKYGLKDFGTIMGAHGEILDRIDDIIYTMPFWAVLISWL